MAELESMDRDIAMHVLDEIILRCAIDEPSIVPVLKGLDESTLLHAWGKIGGDLRVLSDLRSAMVEEITELRIAALGSGLVIAQRFIVTITEKISAWASSYAKTQGIEAVTFKKMELMRVPGFTLKGASYTRIELVNAFANLFKHEDQWTAETWARPTKEAANTVPLVKSAGAGRGKSNVRIGLHAIVPHQRHPLTALGRLLHKWAKAAELHAIRKLGTSDTRAERRKQIQKAIKGASGK